jgi:hypothetical protein
MFVHRDCPASENGATPAALNFGTSSITWAQVVGGCTPTLSKTFLL